MKYFVILMIIFSISNGYEEFANKNNMPTNRFFPAVLFALGFMLLKFLNTPSLYNRSFSGKAVSGMGYIQCHQ